MFENLLLQASLIFSISFTKKITLCPHKIVLKNEGFDRISSEETCLFRPWRRSKTPRSGRSKYATKQRDIASRRLSQPFSSASQSGVRYIVSMEGRHGSHSKTVLHSETCPSGGYVCAQMSQISRSSDGELPPRTGKNFFPAGITAPQASQKTASRRPPKVG